MTDKKHLNRIPAAEAGRWQSWALPDVDNASRVASNEKLARDKGGKRKGESVEDVDIADVQNFSGMTAEQLHDIVQSAEKEGFDKGYQDGLQQGRDEGYKAGQQQGLSEMRSQLMADQKRFNDLAKALLSPVEEQDQRLEDLLLTMVERLSQAVVRRELVTDPADIRALVRHAVSVLPSGPDKLRIFLNPEDLERVESYTREQPGWHFIADPEMATGGVRVETDDSVVNDSVERRLQEVIERFLQQQDSDEASTDESLFGSDSTVDNPTSAPNGDENP